MADITVACGCGRRMALDALRGAGAYRCGCGARIKIEAPVYSKETCVARIKERRCAATPHTDDPVPLCKPHFREMRVAFDLVRTSEIDDYRSRLASAQWSYVPRDVIAGDPVAELAVRKVDQREAAHVRMVEATEGGPIEVVGDSFVVYYLLFGDRIKIGYSSNLQQRLRAIPHDELLATEPGGSIQEEARHKQFEAYRLQGEWFEMGEELVDHINELKRAEYRRLRIPENLRRYLQQRA